MKPLDDIIGAFRNEKKRTRIAIFKNNNAGDDRIYQDLYTFFSKKNYVELVDIFFLYSYEGLHADTIDILVVPEVNSLIPLLCYRIENYLRWGGAVIIAGNDMLMQGKTKEEVDRTRRDWNNVLSHEDDPQVYFRGTMGHLGIKPYIADVDPVNIKFNVDFIKNVPKNAVPFNLYRDGVRCNTTSNGRTPFPFEGCAFSERYEVLRNYDIVSGYDGIGRKVNSAVTFSENWETGARLCVFPSTVKDSFFDPANPYFEAVLNGAVDFCENKFIVSAVMPRYVCYREGETPYIDYKIKSFSKNAENIAAEITIYAEGKKVYSLCNSHPVEAGKEISGTAVWNNIKFKYDFYEIEVKIIRNNKVVSIGTNAFVIWNEEVVTHSIEMKNDGDYFDIENRKTVVLGINYYESNTNSHMWVMPNISKLNSDFKQMADFGINFIRIHYHHPKWFYDYWMQRYNTVPEIYADLGNSYLPSEKQLRIFDAHIYLCQKYKIIYGGDLFTLVPEEMGDPRGWYGAVDFCSLENKLKAQKEFLSLIIPRYKDVSGISWDIINEPYINNDPETRKKFHGMLSSWENKIKNYMVELGETHPITVGNDSSGLQETGTYTGSADYLAPHANYRSSADLKWDSYKGPQLYHEVHMDADFSPAGEEKQLDYMKTAILNTFRTGLAGFAPWQWTGQLAMWQSTGTHHGENWDDMLGCCVRHDGTIKPSGRFYRDFIHLFHDLTLIKFEGNNKIRAKEGTICFKAAEKVKPGEYYYSLVRDGRTVRGIAKSFCSGESFSINTGGKTASVFFDIGENGTVWIKADEPCAMEIKLPVKPRKAFITDGLEQKEINFDKSDTIKINVLPWETYCWFKFE